MNYPNILDLHFNESQKKFIYRTVRINATIGSLKDKTYKELIEVLGYVQEQESLLRNFIKMTYERLESEKKYGR